ncbi:YjfB family protein [Thalassobacillus pellis]|uniref:YjfB family protein n=1 Tax=Thalassobacillus pellis TaxID=748008 RepID=UPI00195FB855|nr:YjfB family protein [Thalassobacillus pellis]MBM7551729.1 hypothetical protein [Thalassobacillus pellis]
MDIAAMSVIMNQAQLKQNAGIALMDKAMNQMEAQGAGMLEMIQSQAPAPAHPDLGAKIDMKA